MNKTYEVWQTEALATRYLSGVRGAIPLATEQIDVILRLIRNSQNQVENVLDLGCGDGILGRVILNEYREAKGIFLDFSETMIAAAKGQMGDNLTRAEFIIQDYGKRGWVDCFTPDLKFDVIVSGFSIHHQPDERKKEIYQEIYGLLKPGGLFINLEHVASLSKWGESLFDEMFVDALYSFHHSQGSTKSRAEIDQEYYNRDDRTANILAPTETQCDWLREIGFMNVDCFLKIFEIALFGGIRPLNQYKRD
ncbi:MAG: class I SAM-dependent methyltransferase [Nostocaceae cyanobacterium]|nr:class I SAM-dependent methyltransferase [Nostocaceae cyanobacterium]